MKRAIFFAGIVVLTGIGLTTAGQPALAQDQTADLQKQIQALQERIAVLESRQQDHKASEETWDPFQEMGRMHQRVNQMMRQALSGSPAMDQGIFSSRMDVGMKVDIDKDKDGYVITCDLTGMNQDKVDIQVEEHAVTIRSEQQSQETSENQGAYVTAQSYGSFIQTIPLPDDADTGRMKTEKQGDTLVIRLPIKEKKDQSSS